MKTQKDIFEDMMDEAQSLNIDTDKVFEPIKGKFATLKTRMEMLQHAIKEQEKTLSTEMETAMKTDTKETKPSGRVEMVSNNAEERLKKLSDAKRNLNTERQ
jgi:hypothetical protein